MEPTDSSTFRLYAEVIVHANFSKVLDYGIPESLSFLQEGMAVRVPIRGKERSGIIYKIKDFTNIQGAILPIHSHIASGITLSKDLMELMLWMSQYYFTPLGKTLHLFLPALSSAAEDLVTKQEDEEESGATNKKKKKVLPITEDQISYLLPELPEPIILNPEQKVAVEKITDTLFKGVFRTHLLFGITGSGKTEVYLRAIRKARELNRDVIFLVPEIALTVQVVTLLKAHFGREVGVLHNKISDKERKTVWKEISEGKIHIVVGPRSALFCPVKNLGLIVVDEEQDTAYKQVNELFPCYQGRDVAVMRGKLAQATVILGSATPSIESYANALSQKYTLSVLPSKAIASSPPKVTLVNMNEEKEKTKSLFSRAALQGIEKRLQAGEQALVFLNRRGYHTNVSCSECKHVLRCPHCDIVLTFHKYDNSLLCHFCNYTLKVPQTSCPQCRANMTLQYRGSGTEKIESSLQKIFPNIRTLRVDSDTTQTPGSIQHLFHQFSTGKADVLIGTQMIAKGMHFPFVTLAIILNGDSGLYIPDFRSAEQVFQLITQVAGRSGRSHLPGEVIVQSFLPDNQTIQYAIDQDFPSFYEWEIKGRLFCSYPPYTRLIRCILFGKDAASTLQEAEFIHKQVRTYIGKETDLLPISPCGHFKVKDQFYYQFLMKSKHVLNTNKALHKALSIKKISKKVKLLVDVDPITTFF